MDKPAGVHAPAVSSRVTLERRFSWRRGRTDAGRVEENPKRGSRLVVMLGGAELEHLCLGLVEVIDDYVEVYLLRVNLVRPLRRCVWVMSADLRCAARRELEP